jgi:hypothetical protein
VNTKQGCDEERVLRLLPSLGTREILAFGAGVALPTRFTFPRLAEHLILRSEVASGRRLQADLDDRLIGLMIERWRGAMTNKQSLEEAG